MFKYGGVQDILEKKEKKYTISSKKLHFDQYFSKWSF